MKQQSTDTRAGIFRSTLFIIVLLAAVVAVAADPLSCPGAPLSPDDKAALLQRMKVVYERIQDFQAVFRETRKVAALKTPLEYRGTLYYQKETLLFLSYNFPVTSVMQVKDGKALLWVAESPVADRMAVSTAGDVAGQSEIFGWNPAAFEGDIHETETGYLLMPQAVKEGVPPIRITIDKQTLTMKHLIMEPEGGDRTELYLSDLKINEGLPASILDFILPEGTRINEIHQP